MKKILGLVAVVMFGTTVASHAVTINFDDGASGSSVSSFYSGLGVTFENTEWTPNLGVAGTSGTLGIRANGTYFWTSSSPVVALFGSGASMVGVRGIDVGVNGLRIDAFDSTVGGLLVGSKSVFGASRFGEGEFYDLSVNFSSIRRVEIYQILNIDDDDGVILDNFQFTPVSQTPLPAALPLFATVLGVGGLIAWRRKRKAAALATG